MLRKFVRLVILFVAIGFIFSLPSIIFDANTPSVYALGNGDECTQDSDCGDPWQDPFNTCSGDSVINYIHKPICQQGYCNGATSNKVSHQDSCGGCGCSNGSCMSCTPTSTPIPTPTSGPGPTSTPAPTSPPSATSTPIPTFPPPPPSGGSMQCWMIKPDGTRSTTGDGNIYTYDPGTNNISVDLKMHEANGGCWGAAYKDASIVKLAPNSSSETGCSVDVVKNPAKYGATTTPYTVSLGDFSGGDHNGPNEPCGPNNSGIPTGFQGEIRNENNCISPDTGSDRDRYGPINLQGQTPSGGNYCMEFEDGGHGAGSCNNGGYAYTVCEFTINSAPIATPTPTLTPTPTPIPTTCSITSTTQNLWTFGNSSLITNDLTVKYTGSPNLTNLWVERKDGAATDGIYSSQLGSSIPGQKISGKYYYNVGICNGGTNCTVDVATPTDLGEYYLWCDNIIQPPAPALSYGCSGNPNCSYKNPSSSQVCDPTRFYSCSSLDNRAPISGNITDTGVPLANAPINNNPANYSQCNVKPPYAGESTSGSTDNNGYFLIDNIPVDQSFCLRPDIIPGYNLALTTNSEYNNNLASPLGVSAYECQLNGGKYSGNCTSTATYNKYDVTADNSYNFAENIMGTPTPTPVPLSGGSCSVSSLNNNFYVNNPIYWTVSSPSGGSGNYSYQWFDDTGNGDTTLSPKSPYPIWTTSYPVAETINAHVMISDLTYTSLPAIRRDCPSEVISVPSNVNVSGDVHSNK